jgi:hypothetical protein
MKIESKLLWEMHPEYLNENMLDEKKSEFNKGWNKCIDEFCELIELLEKPEEMKARYAKDKYDVCPTLTMQVEMLQASLDRNLPEGIKGVVQVSEDGSTITAGAISVGFVKQPDVEVKSDDNI